MHAESGLHSLFFPVINMQQSTEDSYIFSILQLCFFVLIL